MCKISDTLIIHSGAALRRQGRSVYHNTTPVKTGWVSPVNSATCLARLTLERENEK